MRIALLSTVTAEFLSDEIKKQFCDHDVEIFCLSYTQYQEQIFNTDSDLYQFHPDLVIFYVHSNLFFNEFDLHELKEKSLDLFHHEINIIKSLSEHISIPILVNNFIVPPNALGTLNTNSAHSFLKIVQEMNSIMHQLCDQNRNIYIYDLQKVVYQYGYNEIFDSRCWYLTLSPFSRIGCLKITKEIYNTVLAVFNMSKKCIVLDLDNTLWGGVLAEDGLEAIQLSESGIGKVFIDFQRQLKLLKDMGFILAVCSKNNFDDIKPVFNHPAMVLTEEDFVSMKINWNKKSDNIKEIASEINISLNSMVFIDDSAFECDAMQAECPEVSIIRLPENPEDYVAAICDTPYFNKVYLFPEDTFRTESYQSNKKRDEKSRSFDTVEEFLKSLDIKITLRDNDPFIISRILELLEKTNQFNLTHKKYAEAEINNMFLSNEYKVLCYDVEDVYGKNGIVGVVFIKMYDDYWDIEQFLLSCRVLGRGIEDHVLHYILDKAKASSSVTYVKGNYVSTQRNSVCARFYLKNNFTQIDKQTFKFDLILDKLRINKYIEMVDYVS